MHLRPSLESMSNLSVCAPVLRMKLPSDSHDLLRTRVRTGDVSLPAVSVMARIALFILLGISSEIVIAEEPDVAADWGKPKDLLREELTSVWKEFTSADVPPDATVWKRVVNEDPEKTELICTGEPRGFLHTRKQYSTFDLRFEWRYARDPNGNSGVLVFTQDDPKLWPTSVQVQLHQPVAGSVFPVGDAASLNRVKNEGLAKAVGEWNHCRIVSEAGKVVVHVNGMKAGEVSGCKPSTGTIAIQSEGSEVHFRRMQLRLPPEKPSETAASGESQSQEP